MKTWQRLLRLLVLVASLFVFAPRAEAARNYCPSSDPCTDCEMEFNVWPFSWVNYCVCAYWDQWSHCCMAYCYVDYFDEQHNFLYQQGYQAWWNYCGCNPF